MIILSHTNLSGINLGGINLSEIKLGMPSGKGTGGEETFDPASFNEAWTVTGKTNDDEDRATVKNLTGNGNDLVLSNFAFAEDSGYGLYKLNFSEAKWTIAAPSRVEATKTNSSFNVTKVKGVSIQLYYLSNKNDVVFTVPSTKVRVTGLTDGQTINYRYFIDGTANDFLISTDGMYDLPEFEFPAKGDYYGFNFTKIQDSCNITIEQIPDYEGYLVTDGVDDFVASSNFNLYDDFTFVGEWILLSTDVSVNAGIVKASKLYIYNYITGISLFINGTGSAANTILQGIKSLKAICSDGRAYDENWNEIIVKFDVHGRENNSFILGSNTNNSNFTPLAFKNGAFYSDKVLTKDQCINAYNYLQTLKEK